MVSDRPASNDWHACHCPLGRDKSMILFEVSFVRMHERDFLLYSDRSLSTRDSMSIPDNDAEHFSPLTHVTTIYCTLQGIIQGVSLVVLTEQCFDEPKHILSILDWAPYALACLMYVIQITFKYTVLMAGPFSRTKIGAADIGIVIALGVFEYVPMYYVIDGKPVWVLTVWLLALWGLVALFVALHLVGVSPENKIYPTLVIAYCLFTLIYDQKFLKDKI